MDENWFTNVQINTDIRICFFCLLLNQTMKNAKYGVLANLLRKNSG